jgi:hypothetical protein
MLARWTAAGADYPDRLDHLLKLVITINLHPLSVNRLRFCDLSLPTTWDLTYQYIVTAFGRIPRIAPSVTRLTIENKNWAEILKTYRSRAGRLHPKKSAPLRVERTKLGTR